MNGILFVLTGPSGTGKTSIERYLVSQGVPKVITLTTRSPRPGEKNGVHYYFLSPGQFENTDKIEQVEYAGNKYGIGREEILDKLRKFPKVIVAAEKNGVKKLKETFPDNVKVIHITVESLETLRKRLEDRGESCETIDRRMDVAAQDWNASDMADYVVVNRDFEETVKEIERIMGMQK